MIRWIDGECETGRANIRAPSHPRNTHQQVRTRTRSQTRCSEPEKRPPSPPPPPPSSTAHTRRTFPWTNLKDCLRRPAWHLVPRLQRAPCWQRSELWFFSHHARRPASSGATLLLDVCGGEVGISWLVGRSGCVCVCIHRNGRMTCGIVKSKDTGEREREHALVARELPGVERLLPRLGPVQAELLLVLPFVIKGGLFQCESEPSRGHACTRSS